VKKIYLCGGINGLSDADAKGWRTIAAELLAGRANVLDPMARDYRGKEAQNVAAIVEGDMRDIGESDVLLVNASRPSWGTAMEIAKSFDLGKRVIVFGAGPRPSPWLCYHSHAQCNTVEQAVELILLAC
jgi:hypothetical protein